MGAEDIGRGQVEDVRQREGDAYIRTDIRSTTEVERSESELTERQKEYRRDVERRTDLVGIEKRLSSRMDEAKLGPDLDNWKRPLLVGGTRLLAQEIVLREVLREPMKPESPAPEIPSVGNSNEMRRPMGERIRLLIELVGIALGRILILRAAGLRAKQQQRVASALAKHNDT